jgi:hypothetical protein
MYLISSLENNLIQGICRPLQMDQQQAENVLAFSIPVNPLTDIRKKYNSVPI